ncbi:c-type cytochrome [Aquibacillus halophilus]|uniref:C-type cytochrome n=1 Tax=Aquibacillus halophilus TaxID=930132 RepID=A0A6A8DGG9_9BACI|nr:cytochrome c [Aquibacillus halophilus]MRH41987.1 c-type cytochrome [Aquibacillus halophilus]
MRMSIIMLFFGAVLALSGCGSSSSEESKDPAEVAFRQNCASCHGGDLSGGAGPSLESIGSKYSKEEILDIIHNGIGAMTAGKARGEDAELIATWLAAKK